MNHIYHIQLLQGPFRPRHHYLNVIKYWAIFVFFSHSRRHI